VPKYARRESMFFKELKQQDESEDKKRDESEVENENAGCVDEGGENPAVCDEVSIQPVITQTASQLDDDDDEEEDVVIGFTSLQSGPLSFVHPETCPVT